MFREEQLENFPAQQLQLVASGGDLHALGNRSSTGCGKAAHILHLHHAEAATAVIRQAVKVAQ
jgi:hypothetical protein